MDYSKMTPFVRWAGGKKQLLERLGNRMPDQYGTYYEPFVGGGALLLDRQPGRAVINDANGQLINVYRQLRANAGAVIDEVNRLDTVHCDKIHYQQMRTKYNEMIKKKEQSPECAALMIWINKHCFNGLYRVNSMGLFNVPYNNRSKGQSMTEDNLRNIGAYLRKADITICEGDFEIACKDAQSGDFVYLDPPYYPVSPTADFTDYTQNGFILSDHERAAKLFRDLDEKGTYVMMSNSDTPAIWKRYNGFHIETVDVKRNINRDGSKRTGREVIITNY